MDDADFEGTLVLEKLGRTPEPSFVRLAEPSDVPRILALYAELDELHRQHHPELYPAEGVRRERAWLEGMLVDPKVGLLVAGLVSAEGETVAGFVRIVDVQTPEGRVLSPRRFGLLEDLVVAPAARRQGLAKLLVCAAEDWARHRGLEAVEVTVWAFNRAAQELYENAGFGTLRHYLRKTL